MNDMMYVLNTIGGIVLIWVYFTSSRDRDSAKSITVAFLLAHLIININVGHFFTGVGIYAYQILSEFALVLCLHIKACRETALIMMLSLVSVTVGICGFSYEIINGRTYELDLVVNSSLMAVFYVMLLVLINKGLSNRVYDYLNNASAVRRYCSGYLKINKAGAGK
jgi:hypothetical protein